MLRHVKGNRLTLIKETVKAIAWKVFGLDISIAPHHVHPYTYNYNLASRFIHFYNLLNEIEDIEGSIVECGVGPGQSLFEFSVISTRLDKPRHIYGFDTFRGLPAPTPVDGEWNVVAKGFWNYSQEHVRDELLLAGLDRDFISANITFIEGEFSESIPPLWEGEPIALLHLDCDIYESYRVALERLYNYVTPGGIIAFDEYGYENWPGATKAIDEFFEDKPESVIQSPVSERHYTVKQDNNIQN